MTATSLTTQVPLWRKLIAGAAGLFSAIYFVTQVNVLRETAMLAVPVGGPVLAALIVHRPTLGAQLLARAIWWSNLGLGAILCIVASYSDLRFGLLMTFGHGLALLVIGRKGLAEASERAAFLPAAFRSSLLLLMVLALADAQSLAFFTVIEHYKHWDGVSEPLALGAVAFTVGFIGLYRLALWGALLSFATALTLFILTVGGALRLDHNLQVIVPMIMGFHVLAAAPMLVATALKKPLPAPPQRVRAFMGPVAITIVMTISISFGLYRYGL
jgi:hypothetical protein